MRKAIKAILAALIVIYLIHNANETRQIKEDYGIAIHECETRITQLEEVMRVIERPTIVISEKSTLNDYDRELIERVVASESRGESLAGCMAVCQVIKDRSELWNKSYEEVLTADKQFAAPYEGVISEKVQTAVRLVFDYGYRVTKDYTTHFYAHGLISEPYWAKEKTLVLELDGHRFYK